MMSLDFPTQRFELVYVVGVMIEKDATGKRMALGYDHAATLKLWPLGRLFQPEFVDADEDDPAQTFMKALYDQRPEIDPRPPVVED